MSTLEPKNTASEAKNIALEVQIEPEFPWRRNLYIVWTAQFIAMIGMSGCIPFLPLYIRDLGVKDPVAAQWWSGLIYSAPFFISVLITPLWGIVGDRVGRKFMVVRALFGLMIAIGLMGFARNVWDLFFLRLMQGAISGFIASNLALVSSSTPKEHSGYAIGMIQTSVSAGATIGPMIGGVLSDAFGTRCVFFIVAAMCLVSQIIVIGWVREKRSAIVAERITFRAQLATVLRNSKLVKFMICIVLAQSGINFVSPILAYYLESLQTPADYIGTLTGVMVGVVGLLTTIFGPIWGKRNDKKGYSGTLRLVVPILTLATIAQSLPTHYLQLFPLRFTIGIFAAGLIPTLYTVLNKNSPSQRQGVVMGFASSSTMLGNLIGPLLCSAVAASWGMRLAFLVAGTLLTTVYVFLIMILSHEETVPSSISTR